MSYPKAVMDQAFLELSRRRDHSRQQFVKRQEEIANRLPQVAEIDKELMNTSVALSKAILSGTDIQAKVERLRDTNLYMQEMKTQLLIQGGYAPDYLQLQHQCPHCQDSGFTQNGMCSCMQSILKSIAYRRLGESSNLLDCTFDNFHLEYYSTTPLPGKTASPRQVMTQAYQRCMDYAKGFSPKSPSLFFQGATGLGKTHLSLAIAAVVIEKGYDVLYTPTQGLLNRLERERFSRGNDSMGDSMVFVLESDLLVLDDLGAEFSTSFSVSALYNILNTRLIEGRPTIISTNLEIGEIESRYSQRILSRLMGGCSTVPFVGSDIRMRKS